MFNIWVENNKIKIKSSDPNTRYLLESKRTESKYLPWAGKWGAVTTNYKIYDSKKTTPDGVIYTLGLGWAGYVVNVFKSQMTGSELNDLLRKAVYSENYRSIPFKELRDYQNEDVLHFIKYRVGLFSCYTGYGKGKNLPHYVNYIVKLRVKTVKTEMLIPC